MDKWSFAIETTIEKQRWIYINHTLTTIDSKNERKNIVEYLKSWIVDSNHDLCLLDNVATLDESKVQSLKSIKSVMK